MESKTNDLLIGFVVSGLLSLFVNFPLVTRSYEMVTGVASSFPSAPEQQYMLLFAISWFFIYAFALFVINGQIYTLGNRLFRNSEYGAILSLLVVGMFTGWALCNLFPVARQFVLNDLLGFDISPGEKFIFRPEHQGMREMIDSVRPEGMPDSNDLQNRFKPGMHGPFFFPMFFEHLFVTFVIMLSVVLLRLLRSKQQMHLAYEQLKSEKLQTSYNALMGQINPHFFFNSLNGLSALIRQQKQEQTLTYLDELSSVFRYILQSNNKEMVTLAEELQFVKAYTYLLQVRYEGKFATSIQADPSMLLYKLPILSILPLLENAVKHNVISRQYPLQIDIYTTSDSKVVVSNRIQPKREQPEAGGLGLKNLWGRYRMLTGKDLEISNRKEYFKVFLPLVNS